MSALFHAFHLCQLWTVYCEQAAATHPESELGFQAMANVMDFWARVTPAILQLLSHSKVVGDFLTTLDLVGLFFPRSLVAAGGLEAHSNERSSLKS